MKNLLIATFIVLLAAVSFGAVHAAEFFCQSGDVTCLVNAIKKANSTRRPDTIKLEPGVYTLRTAAETSDDGPNGLPSITSEIKIIGKEPHNTVIERDPTLGNRTANFRIVHVGEAGNLTLDSLAIKGGVLFASMNDNGPGVLNRGTTTITNSIITQNVSVFGSGGILNMGGTVTVTDSVIAHNEIVEGVGGGVASFGGTTTITNSTIANNSADSGGGGIAGGGIINIGSSSITNNGTLLGPGGGLFFGGTATITNSTVAENGAFSVSGGGGIAIFSGTLTVTNSTIANNVVDTQGEDFGIESAGGGIHNGGGTVELQNVILARNSAVRGPDCGGGVKSLGNNLIGNTTDCDVTFLMSDLIGDPKLGALVGAEEDGRPGRAFFPVLADSPVIDAGNPDTCPETDQLGNPRRGICDIGSIEFHDRLLVMIDFRPRSDANKIDPNSKSKIAVAIVSDDRFDANNVDLNTVRFGATGTEASPIVIAKKNFDRDKDRDLVLFFEIRDTEIMCGDTSATLTGETLDGIPIIGSSPIKTVNCKNHKGQGHHFKKRRDFAGTHP